MRPVDVIRLRAVAVLLAAVGLPTPAARADHCAPLVEAPADDLGLTARLNLETARYSRPLVEGSWSGLSTELGGRWGRFQTRGWIGAYQLDRGGVVEQGIGDAGLDLRATAWRRDEGRVRFSLGPSLAVTLPTGNAANGFGMGHAMLLPGLWWALPGDRIRAGGTLVYGRALGDTGGHHHGPGPIIDPMNMSELMTSAGLDVALLGPLRGDLVAAYAHPLVHDGAARASAGLGLSWNARPVRFGAAVHLPLVGDAFQVRAIASAGLEL